MPDLESALAAVARLGAGPDLTRSIGAIERSLVGASRNLAADRAEQAGFSADALTAALLIKAAAGQINVVVHAIGILVSLPFVLADDERILSLSLGAGNTGRSHDLESNKQIAEFKFIEWRGGAESIRQNGLFVDLFNLASTETTKRRVMYVVGSKEPLRFLGNQRAISSVLSKNASVARRFSEVHGDTYRTVSDYWQTIRDVVEIVDLGALVPALHAAVK